MNILCLFGIHDWIYSEKHTWVEKEFNVTMDLFHTRECIRCKRKEQQIGNPLSEKWRKIS